MDDKNAIEINNITKTFKIDIEDTEKKTSIFNRTLTKTIENKVIDGISLQVKKGDVLAVLGRNGAGKSILLSLIARIMEPDSGHIEYNGKVTAILELGMGFQGDMTGRENIYLKGQLYGLSKDEITAKMDKIIEYSGITQYIDNPVRTYSSGMAARLAFSIMINIESEIMLVDEVLSVGDAAFESKAIEHFKQLARSGKTIIIVSHQIELLQTLCNRAIWIENGKIIRDGDSKKICSEYQNKISESPEIIFDLANAGVADSQYKLALMYRDGKIVEQNNELYEYWIGQSAHQGHAKAQSLYGDILLQSDRLNEALRYYQYAANKGDADAKVKLASCTISNESEIAELRNIFKQIAKPGFGLFEYRYADLILKTAINDSDRKEAFNIFLKSAEDGFPNAMFQVAIMYRDGIGTAKNVDEMKKWFEKAGALGFLPAITTLADIYKHGKLLQRDETKVFELYLHAAELGHNGSIYEVATMYKNGIGVQADAIKSEEWFKKFSNSTLFWFNFWAAEAIKTGLVSSTISSDELYEKASDNNNPAAIGSLYLSKVNLQQSTEVPLTKLEKLTSSGNIDAIKRIGNYYYDGIGVTKDYAVALKWYEKSANLGDVWSNLRCGDMYRDGKGTNPDPEKALKYYEFAAGMYNLVAIGNIISLISTNTIKNEEIFEKYLNILKAEGESGNVDALKRVGNLYHDGIGLKRDYTEAIYWYEKAAKLGDAWSKLRVAEMYREGRGTTRDLVKASQFFTM